MMKPQLATMIVVAVVLLTGCAEKQALYRWGVYEALLYDLYAKPGRADPGTQVVKLSEDVTRTQAEGKRVPPGVHAHLGYMYYLQGNTAEAQRQFATERARFPESSTFIDGILKRLGKE